MKRKYDPEIQLLVHPLLDAAGLPAGRLWDKTSGQVMFGPMLMGSRDVFEIRFQELLEAECVTPEQVDMLRAELERVDMALNDADLYQRLMAAASDETALGELRLQKLERSGPATGMFFKGQAVAVDNDFTVQTEAYSAVEWLVANRIATPQQAFVLFKQAVTTLDLPVDEAELKLRLTTKLAAHWIQGHHRPLFERAGVVYGIIILEDASHFTPVASFEDAIEALMIMRRRGLITLEMLGTIKEQMRLSGIEGNFGIVVQKLNAVEIPADLDMDGHAFQPCTGCLHPLPHGYFSCYGDVLPEPIDHLRKALEALEVGTEAGLTVDQAISMFKQCMAANLPLDEDDAKRLFDALPPDKRHPLVTDFLGVLADRISKALGGRRPRPTTSDAAHKVDL